MTPGNWNIPVPADGVRVEPDTVVSPVVGFDPVGFRLGFGAAFYDRTLAACTRRPRVAGVGFAIARIDTIHPLPHDIAIDFIVTEDGCSPAPQVGA